MPHAHSLIGKNSNDGVVTVQIGPEHGMTARYCNLVIVIKVKTYMPEICLWEEFLLGSHKEIPVSFYGRSEFSLIYVQFYTNVDLSDGLNDARGAS